jgi:peptidoglycan/xylan/chitin deacetylase (PgdA/CDA1 family)
MRSLRAAAAPLAKTALMRLGGYAALRRIAPSRQLAILRYHAICGADGYTYADSHICVTPDNFEAHVRYLTSAYTVMPLDRAVRALAEGRVLPSNAVAITFDDGYVDNFAAAQTLARYGATATFYITAGCLDGGMPFWPAELRHLVRAIPPSHVSLQTGTVQLDLDLTSDSGRDAAVQQLTRTFKANPIPVREMLREQLRNLAEGPGMPRVMLTWSEVRQMHAMGMTIGSHTMTHPNLPSAGLTAAQKELACARQRLEREIDAPVKMFSYPNGGAERYVTREIARLVKEVGYDAATTSRNAFAGPHSDPFGLERVQVAERLEDLIFSLEVERFILQPAPRSGESR